MSPKVRTNFMIEPAQHEALRQIKERDGISEGEQIRRAIDLWLEQKGVTKKTAKRSGRTPRKA